MKIINPSVKLLWITPDAEKIIEYSGRVCYESDSSISDISSNEFIKKIINKGHDSVLEHASASFEIICDRGISHELVRHRLASFSQASQRYCNYNSDRFGKEIIIIIPDNITEEQKELIVSSAKVAEQTYIKLIESGCSPQFARSVLPTCIRTRIVVTCNLREWRHIIDLRTSKAAHPQFREIANAILKILHNECPSVFPLVA